MYLRFELWIQNSKKRKVEVKLNLEVENYFLVVTLFWLITFFQGYIFWPFLSKVKNREKFEGGLEKRKGKGAERIKKRVIKHTLKYLYEA